MDSLKLSRINVMVKYQLQDTQDAQQPIFWTMAPSGATKTLLRHQGRIDIPLLFNKVMEVSRKIFYLLKIKTLLLPYFQTNSALIN